MKIDYQDTVQIKKSLLLQNIHLKLKVIKEKLFLSATEMELKVNHLN